MKIDFIGTGKIGCTNRCYTSVLLDKEILFDIGAGVYYQLKRLNKDICKIKYLFISHYHVDHFSDIADFLTNLKVKRYKDNINELLTIIGPKDIKQQVSDIMLFLEPNLIENRYENIEESYNIKFVEMLDSNYKDDNLEVESITLKHGKTFPNNGYILNYKNQTISYTGDTALCDGLEYIIKKSNILLIDTSYIETKDWHIGLKDVERFALENPMKKFYAIHRDDYEYSNTTFNLYFHEDGETINII